MEYDLFHSCDLYILYESCSSSKYIVNNLSTSVTSSNPFQFWGFESKCKMPCRIHNIFLTISDWAVINSPVIRFHVIWSMHVCDTKLQVLGKMAILVIKHKTFTLLTRTAIKEVGQCSFVALPKQAFMLCDLLQLQCGIRHIYTLTNCPHGGAVSLQDQST